MYENISHLPLTVPPIPNHCVRCPKVISVSISITMEAPWVVEIKAQPFLNVLA
jgi:hypothetical protein